MANNYVCGDGPCTACGACVDACPFEALIMSDSSGEPAPQVDSRLCRDCGRCHAVCPMLNPVGLKRPFKTFAAWSCASDDVERSSSGGLATALARVTIEGGGIVFGTASRDGIARCVEVSELDGLEALRGSKYVYSSPEGAYRRVSELIAQGTQVFFVSTPCQVAALRSFLGGKDEGLLCADLICHGTPAMGYLREHLTSHARVPGIRFRSEVLANSTSAPIAEGILSMTSPASKTNIFPHSKQALRSAVPATNVLTREMKGWETYRSATSGDLTGRPCTLRRLERFLWCSPTRRKELKR